MPSFLKDSFKTYSLDQDKAVPPKETVSRVKERLKSANKDILRETMRVDKGRLGIPVYMSICGNDARETIGTHKQMGKGATPEQAEASALMELMERYALFSFMKLPFVCCKKSQLEGDAIPFETIVRSVHDETLGRSEEFGKARELWDTLPLTWARAYDPANDKQIWLPVQWFYTLNEFNGSSAGNTLAEAIVQGLCEVVERHVCSVVTNDRLQTPMVDPVSINGGISKDLLHKYDGRGIKLFIKDFTLRMGIPTIAALAMDPSTFPERSEMVYTAGTATNPEKALIRALTEIAQLAGDFDTDGKYAESGLPKFSDLSDADYIVSGNGTTAALSSLPDISHPNQKVEVEQCVEILSRKGFPVYVFDITHPALQIPAAYVAIPGTHFRERTRNNSVCLHAAKLISQLPDSQMAICELQRVDQAYPDRYEVSFFLGYAYERADHFDKALECYDRALNLDADGKEKASSYCHRGLCYKEQGRYERALDELEKALSFNSELKEIYNLMGFCYFKLKDHLKSIACFERAINLDPSSAIDYANIGSNLREMGHLEEAIRWYESAVDIDPSIQFAHDNIIKLKSSLRLRD